MKITNWRRKADSINRHINRLYHLDSLVDRQQHWAANLTYWQVNRAIKLLDHWGVQIRSYREIDEARLLAQCNTFLNTACQYNQFVFKKLLGPLGTVYHDARMLEKGDIGTFYFHKP